MIRVAENAAGVAVTGHAGHGPPGQDIVCAAVSALVQTLALSLDRLAPGETVCSMEPGSATIRYTSLSEEGRLLVCSFFVGVRYFRGDVSPNNLSRKEKGYSSAWLHHKGRNKHHLEYWIDYGVGDDQPPLVGMRMPEKYVVEMFIDRMSASKNYQKEKYTDRSALEYYEKGKARHILHPDSRELLERLLHMLAEEGEDATMDYIRREVLRNRRRKRARR